MTDGLEGLVNAQSPTAERPLLGLTVLVVEDSRFASEAMRLLCLRSGARIRRADSLKSAHRHLAVYRPAVVIVDLGLPDGSGAELIAELAHATPRVGVILGISGDDGASARALAAGADGFLEKPISSLSVFQQNVLSHLPPEARPRGVRLVSNDMVDPDPLALLDDLTHITDVLTTADSLDRESVAYAVQFLCGLARIAHDGPLQKVAAALSEHHERGMPIGSDVAKIAGIVQSRLTERRAI